MLKQITEGVWTRSSVFLQTTTTVIQGASGVLLIDPGITTAELEELAKDLRQLNQPVVAGFSTHPHWDHLLWHTAFGNVPRYGTAWAEAEIKTFLSQEDWKAKAAPMLPPDLADQISLDGLFGRITGLPEGTALVPWDGPKIRIIDNQGHATGSAALMVEDSGVLVAGDLLSDILIPFLELDSADPIKDYLAALQLIEKVVDDTTCFIPGHGSAGDAGALRKRLKQDRAYVESLRDGREPNDSRLKMAPNADVHAWQVKQIASKH